MGTRIKAESPEILLLPREFRAINKVLADPRRFEIFRQIAAASTASCAELRKECPITAPTLSHHLKELESARLIEINRAGKFLNASVNRAVWKAYLAELNSI